MTATVPPPVPVSAGTRLLGEVIAWACPGASVTHSDLVRALEDAGLDPGVARELAPRHAFSRACKRLSDQRIIRPVSEDTATAKFQFTQESREGDHYEYRLEATPTSTSRRVPPPANYPDRRRWRRRNSTGASPRGPGAPSREWCRSCSSAGRARSQSGPRAGLLQTGLPRRVR